MRDRFIRESIGVVRRNRWEGDVEKAEKRRGGEGQEEQEDRTRQDRIVWERKARRKVRKKVRGKGKDKERKR